MKGRVLVVDDDAALAEMLGIVLRGEGFEPTFVSDGDKAYLGQLVTQNTGLPADQATARVDQVITAVNDAKAKALEVAEAARKTTVLAAFLTAASLLVSAVGAYWAAMKGGRHRDEGTVFADIFGRY